MGRISARPGGVGHSSSTSAPEAASLAVAAAALRLGMRVDQDNVERWTETRSITPRLCGPLPAPVRAALDALGVSPTRFSRQATTFSRRGPKRYAPDWLAAGRLALETTGGREWDARVWLRTTPVDDIETALDDRLRRWWEGEQVNCPRPGWRTTLHQYTAKPLTPSKLSPAQKAAVAASGIEWPPRTTSQDFARSCATSLEIPMTSSTRLFAVPTVIAVAGGKGGVGKSTLAGAIAGRFAGEGTRTVLFDLDLAGPSQHLVWGLGDVPVAAGGGRLIPTPPPDGPAGLGVISIGQLLAPGEELGWDPQTRVHWLEFLAGAVDLDGVEVVVLDLPPGRSVIYDRLTGGLNDDRQVESWIHVTTAHPLSLDATARLLPERSERPDLPPVLLVENLSRTEIDEGGAHRDIRLVGHAGDVEALAGRRQALYGGSLPYSDSAQGLGATPEIGSLVTLLRTQQHSWRAASK